MQYLRGELGFSKINEVVPFTYDINDEVRAYMMEYAYSGICKITQVTESFVKNINYEGNYIYRDLPRYDISKNSPALFLHLFYPQNPAFYKSPNNRAFTIGDYVNDITFHP